MVWTPRSNIASLLLPPIHTSPPFNLRLLAIPFTFNHPLLIDLQTLQFLGKNLNHSVLPLLLNMVYPTSQWQLLTSQLPCQSSEHKSIRTSIKSEMMINDFQNIIHQFALVYKTCAVHLSSIWHQTIQHQLNDSSRSLPATIMSTEKLKEKIAVKNHFETEIDEKTHLRFATMTISTVHEAYQMELKLIWIFRIILTKWVSKSQST